MGTKYLSVHAQSREASLNRGPLKVPELLLKSSPARFWSVGSSNDNQECLLCVANRLQIDSVNLQPGQTSPSSDQERRFSCTIDVDHWQWDRLPIIAPDVDIKFEGGRLPPGPVSDSLQGLDAIWKIPANY